MSYLRQVPEPPPRRGFKFFAEVILWMVVALLVILTVSFVLWGPK